MESCCRVFFLKYGKGDGMTIKKYFTDHISGISEECIMKRCAEKEFRRKDNFVTKCCNKIGSCTTKHIPEKKGLIK
jgi:hypothetical protein